MKQQTLIFKIVLWVLLGFLFIKVGQILIEALINSYLLYGLSDGFVLIHFKYYVPAFSFIITLILSGLIILILNKKIKTWALKTPKLPLFSFTILFVFALISEPLIRNLSDKKFELLYDDLSKSEYLSNLNLEAIFSLTDYSIYGSEWLMFVALALYYAMRVYRNKK